MGALTDKLLDRVGKSRQDLTRQSKLGKLIKRYGVGPSADLDRVLNIPTRDWGEYDPDLRLANTLTDQLSLKGRPLGQTLKPIQLASLCDLVDFGGLFAPIGVGGGKTLISLLAPTVAKAKNPLLLVPAKLIHKTRSEFATLTKQWLRHPNYVIRSYESISVVKGWDRLIDITPDLIVCDECHRLKNTRSGVTRKVARYMRENKQTQFVAMSGTITTRSLREYWHIIKWCYRFADQLMPLPYHWGVLQEWADCLDAKVDPLRRMSPGALAVLCEGKESLASIRVGFGKRLSATPGTIASSKQDCAASIQVQAIPYKPNIKKAVEDLLTLWELPDGHPLMEASELWRHLRTLACGFWYRWDPEAPEDWKLARKNWAAFVRDILKRNINGIDTPSQVARFCESGKLDQSCYLPWVEIRDTFKPNSVPVWIDDTAINETKKWIRKNPNSLIWVEHRAFGENLAEETGIAYFGKQGQTRTGETIEDHNGTAILSIASNSEGRNLQRYNSNLITSAPPNGRIWEQMIGRTHRQGQESDSVQVDLLIGIAEQENALLQAIDDCRYIAATTGQEQKLLISDLDLSGLDKLKRELAWLFNRA